MIRARFDRWVKDRTLAACFGALSAAARMSRSPLPSTADVAVFTYWWGELSALSFLAHVTGTSRRAAQADRDAAAAADDLDDCDAEPTPARGTPLGGLGVKPLGGAAVATGEDAGGWSSHDADGTTVGVSTDRGGRPVMSVSREGRMRVVKGGSA